MNTIFWKKYLIKIYYTKCSILIYKCELFVNYLVYEEMVQTRVEWFKLVVICTYKLKSNNLYIIVLLQHNTLYYNNLFHIMATITN